MEIYLKSRRYAVEHDEIAVYKESRKESVRCRDDIERLVARNFVDFHFDYKLVAQEIVLQYGLERVLFVLANSVRLSDWDERYSAENKDWAKTVPALSNENDAISFRICKTHPVLLNALIDHIRASYTV